MSLDVYLEGPTLAPVEAPDARIFVREKGVRRELSREEWDARFPGLVEPVVMVPDPAEPEPIYSANITHNLGKMAAAAGIYEHLWRPDEIGIERACDLVKPLTTGLAALLADPERFKALNPANGWGSYDGLVEFVRSYRNACEDSPEATVRVSR